jgi:hypothetical protein
MKKLFLHLLCVLFVFISSLNLKAQTNGAQYIRFTSRHTSFPDTGRKNGYIYDSVLYDEATHYNDGSVLLLVPPQFSAKENVDLIFWFHGWRNNIDTAIVFYELGKQFIASKRNAILILAEAAKNAPDSYGGKLEQTGTFSLLVEDILNELKQRRIISSQIKPGPVTLAGHSGAYRVIAKILQNGEVPVHEVLLFDALYAEESEFMNWIKKDPGNVFVNYYTDHGGTFDNSLEFMGQLQKENIPFIKKEETELTAGDLKNNRVIFVHTPHEHNYIINNPDNFKLLLESKK